MASQLEQQLSNMVDKLHILFRELLRSSEVLQIIPGSMIKLHDKMGLMLMEETADMC